MKLINNLRSAFILSLWAVSHLTYAECTDLPTYNSATGQLSIPCLKVLENPATLYSVELKNRAILGIELYQTSAVQLAGNYKIGDIGPAGGKVFYVDSRGHGKEAKLKDADNSPGSVNVNTNGGIILEPAKFIGGTTRNKADGSPYKNRDGSLQYFWTWYDAVNMIPRKYGAGWRLPTKEELNLLYLNRASVGGLDGDYTEYWSATSLSSNSTNAWYQVFGTGRQLTYSKTGGGVVRAVHEF